MRTKWFSRWTLVASVTLLMLSGFGCQRELSERPLPPDVQLLIVDTLRASSLGVYGYPRATSRALSEFAESAVVFDDVVASAPWTLPSVASILTSNYPRVHGLRARRGMRSTTSLRRGLMTLAEAFQAAGYVTIALVSNPWVSGPKHGLSRGFDVYQAFDGFGATGSADALHEAARRALQGVEGQPVFLYIHYMEPHGPWPRATEESRDQLGPVPNEFLRPLTPEEIVTVGAEPALALEGATSLEEYIEAYDSAIRRWDRSFGDYIEWLEESGRRRNTVIAVTADHGEEFAEHGGWGHGHAMYQELLRVPWILSLPGESRHRRVDSPVSLVDVAPTLLLAAGVTPPDSMIGIDALGAGATTNRDLFSETDIAEYARYTRDADRRSTVLRTGPHKLIADQRGLRVFDLQADPSEQQPETAASNDLLPRRLEDWKRSARARARGLGDTQEHELSESVRDQLRALGYGDD